MIQPKSRHQANVMDAIEGVFCAHHAMLATVIFLQEKVEALEEQNKGLSARMAVMEHSSRCRLRGRTVTDGVVASWPVATEQ